MQNLKSLILIVAAISLIVFSGCSKCDDKNSESPAVEKNAELQKDNGPEKITPEVFAAKKAALKEAAEKRKLEEKRSPLPPVPDYLAGEIDTAIQKIVAECTIDEKHFIIKSCSDKNKARREFYKLIGKRGVMHSLPKMSELISDKNAKMQAAAIALMGDAIFADFGEDALRPNSMNKQTAARFLEKIKEGKIDRGFIGLYAPAAKAATLAGLEKELIAISDADELGVVRRILVRNMMQYGRMKTFTTVKALSGSNSPDDQLAALLSPMEMADPSEEEKSSICEMGRGFLENDKKAVAEQALKLTAKFCPAVK